MMLLYRLILMASSLLAGSALTQAQPIPPNYPAPPAQAAPIPVPDEEGRSVGREDVPLAPAPDEDDMDEEDETPSR
jgi:hypothetical protein